MEPTIPPSAPLRRRWLVGVAGVGVVATAICWWFASPRHDMAGLEGVWRDPVGPRHSYRFGAGGELNSWWDILPHGVVGTWGRKGDAIWFRPASDFQQMDALDGTLRDGTIEWQAVDGRKVTWKRE